MFIVILGPDGCGKSTLIGSLKASPPIGFSDVKSFHLKPGLISRRKASENANNAPYSSAPRGLLSSIAKLLFFGVDYVVGFPLKVHRSTSRSSLLIFDRYYHDVLIDPKRYRFGGPLWMAQMISTLVPQPQLWIILDSSAEILQERKQEVSFEESVAQRQAYLKFAATLDNALVIDSTQPMEQVSNLVRVEVSRLARKHN